MPQPTLGVLLYDAGSGGAVDQLLKELTRTLGARGVRLAGAIQHNTDVEAGCRCQMTLEDLGSGRLVSISEQRGPLARGCHLDTAALEEVVGLATAAVESGAELLVVNKFGKREAEGHGLRQAIEAAVGHDIPVLVAVSRDNRGAWDAFAAGMDTELGSDLADVTRWCLSAIGRGRASERAGGAEAVPA